VAAWQLENTVRVAPFPVLSYIPGGFTEMDTNKEFSEKREKANSPDQGGGVLGVEEEPAGPVAAPPEPHQLTADELEDLKAEAARAKENWEQLLRTAADFENYKKRAAREKQELSRYANESLLQRLIPVWDNFENALAAGARAGQGQAVESLRTGINMIFQQFKAVLLESGLEEIDAINKTFDPNWHEAVAQQERSDLPEGQVVQQLRKGYKLRDRLLRPASVVVAKAKPQTASS